MELFSRVARLDPDDRARGQRHLAVDEPVRLDEQRERFVMPSVAGDITVAFTLTEPGNGTGADLRCSVRREGDTYYLSGEKHLITFGVNCDYWLLFARLEGTHRQRRHGRRCWSTATAPNVTVEDMGEHAGGARHRPCAPGLRPHPGAGRPTASARRATGCRSPSAAS